MTERTITQEHIMTWEASVDYYRAGLRRCPPSNEPRWKERLDAAQAVLDALRASENVCAKWRDTPWT